MCAKVSVCIPVYNGEKYLAECLDSVLTQSFWDIEVIIVDDQSTDGSMDIARSYAKLDKRIQIHENPENLGLVGNWNRALELVSTDYVKYVFQDDIIYPDCISRMMDVMQTYDCPVAACARGFVIEANASKNIRNYFQKKIKKPEHFFGATDYISPQRFGEVASRFPLDNLVGEPSVLLFRKSACEKAGLFDDTFSQFVDFEFALRLISHFGIVFIPDILAYFRVHGGAQSDKNTSQNRSEEKYFKVEFVDNLLFLNKVLEGDNFKGYRKKLEVQHYKNKFRAIMMNFINEHGPEKVEDILTPYYAQAGFQKRIERNLGFYKKTYEAPALSEVKVGGDEAIVWVDEMNEKSVDLPNLKIVTVEEEMLTLRGWAIDKSNYNPAAGVYISIDGQDYPTLYGHKREDIAKHFQNEKLENCGFYTRIHKSKLKEGNHELTFKVINSAGTQWHTVDTSVKLEIV